MATLLEDWEHSNQWFPPGHERHNKKTTPVHKPDHETLGSSFRVDKTPAGHVTLCGEFTDNPYYEYCGRVLTPGDWLLRNGKIQRVMSDEAYQKVVASLVTKLDADLENTQYSSEGPVCPYCIHQFKPDGEAFFYSPDLTQLECTACGKEFTVIVNHLVNWITKIPKAATSNAEPS